MKLLRYRRPVGSIFDLLGTKEDDMTYALGFVASRSPEFVSMLVHKIGGPRTMTRDGLVRLQEIDSDGRTDVEIEWPKLFCAVFEAKRGPSLPTVEQLAKYIPRLHGKSARDRRLVTVTNAPAAYAKASLPGEMAGVPIVHLTWRDVFHLARSAKPSETNRNKALLDEFCIYLKGILGMESSRSNLVYVVSLSGGSEWGVNARDVVNKHGRYFYPVSGKGRWPDPPNYIAFRYEGRLQTIHHVESFSILTEPKNTFPEATTELVAPHYLLELGPEIRPAEPVPTGPGIPRANRVWCMLDLLLTSASVTDAQKETRRRLGEGARDVADDES